MTPTFQQLTKNMTKIDLTDILECWRWRIADMKAVVTVTALGDIFLLGHDDAIYWLQTDTGDLTKVANNMEQYLELLNNEETYDNWFLPLLVEKLLAADKKLNEDEVYSYKKLPVIGGEYSVDNIEPTNISVHFAYTGQICEQIKDLPDGTKVKINYKL
jgi:hypothetical protein